MQVSVPGMYQNPAPYREQILTYSTALALTGRSAACAHPWRPGPPLSRGQGSSPSSLLNLQVALSREGSGPARVLPLWAGSPKTAQSFRVLQPPRETRDLSEPPNGTIQDPQPSPANMHVQF